MIEKLKAFWWLLVVGIPFIFIWYIIAPAFMGTIGFLGETTYNITANITATANATLPYNKGLMPPLEHGIVQSLPIWFWLFPIAFIIFVAIAKFQGKDDR